MRPGIAAIQMCSGKSVSDNLRRANELIAQAANQGAGLVVLPEMFAIFDHNQHTLTQQEPFRDGPIQTAIARMAREHHVWIVAGTIPLCSASPHQYYASCLVFNATGDIVSRYDKIHLFDAHLNDNEDYRESESTLAGHDIVTTDTPWGKLGLAVCYDLRFPELFRHLALQGAELLALPAAFVQTTGLVHWEVLLRARAIENSCYVIAANQVGEHQNGRHSYGHSSIIDPWGTVIAQQPFSEGAIVSQPDRDFLRQTRTHTPFLKHQKIPCGKFSR